jgi:hypothetical protein
VQYFVTNHNITAIMKSFHQSSDTLKTVTKRNNLSEPQFTQFKNVPNGSDAEYYQIVTKRNIIAIIKSFHHSSDNPKTVTDRNMPTGMQAIQPFAFLPTSQNINH